jgi:hypothetical protein
MVVTDWNMPYYAKTYKDGIFSEKPGDDTSSFAGSE